jgi:hypothetical protein
MALTLLARKSCRGRPQSKTLRDHHGPGKSAQRTIAQIARFFGPAEICRQTYGGFETGGLKPARSQIKTPKFKMKRVRNDSTWSRLKSLSENSRLIQLFDQMKNQIVAPNRGLILSGRAEARTTNGDEHEATDEHRWTQMDTDQRDSGRKHLCAPTDLSDKQILEKAQPEALDEPARNGNRSGQTRSNPVKPGQTRSNQIRVEGRREGEGSFNLESPATFWRWGGFNIPYPSPCPSPLGRGDRIYRLGRFLARRVSPSGGSRFSLPKECCNPAAVH